jgi:hypothetical protein
MYYLHFKLMIYEIIKYEFLAIFKYHLIFFSFVRREECKGISISWINRKK